MNNIDASFNNCATAAAASASAVQPPSQRLWIRFSVRSSTSTTLLMLAVAVAAGGGSNDSEACIWRQAMLNSGGMGGGRGS